LRQFDLKPYLGYLPAGLPVKLLGAVVSADVKLAFEQNPTTQVRLSGTVGVDKLAVADAAGGDLLAVQQIKVGLEDVRPLQQVVRLSKVEIQSPQVSAARGRDGRINLVPPAPPAAANAPEKIAGQQAPAGAAAQKASEKSPETPSKAKPWEVAVAQVLVHAGGATWSDDAVAPKARLALSQLELDAKGIALPFAQPLQFTGSATLEKTTLTFGGQATDQAATATLSLNQLPLALAAPYLAQFVEPAVAGQLGADVGVRWSSAGVLVVSAPRVELGSLAVTQGRNPLASVQKIELAGLEADLAQHSVRADRLVITQPKARVERGEDGRWMVERWLKTPAATPPSAPPPKAAVGAGADKPWAVTLGELAVTGGPISVSDLSLAKPAVFEVSAIQLRASQLELGGRKPSTVSLSLRLGAGQTDTGKLSVRGQLTMAPLAVQADIDASQLPVHAFEPYFADRLNIELLRADTSFKGKLRFASADAGPTVRLSGDTTIEEFRANSVVSSLPSGSMTTPTAALATSGGQAAGAPEAAAPSRERRAWSTARCFLGPFRQAQLLGQPQRAHRQAQRVSRRWHPRASRNWPIWSCAAAPKARPRWRSPASSTRWPSRWRWTSRARARPGAAAAVAVFDQVRRPRHRARQAQRGRGLPGAAQRAAHRQQPGGAQPAELWRQGRGRAGQPARQAGRGAAGRPQRRDRHQPAHQRLAQRPAVPPGAPSSSRSSST
jgi:hypothetical protein